MTTVAAPDVDSSGFKPRGPRSTQVGMAVIAASVLGLWYFGAWLLVRTGDPRAEVKLPYPHLIVERFFQDAGMVLDATWVTLSMALMGFAVGSLIAITLAVIMSQSSWAEAALMPYMLMAQMIPVIALVPVIQTILRNPTLTRLMVAAFITILPVSLAAVRGLKSASPEAHELMDSYDAGRLQTLRYLLAPSSLPLLFTGLRIAAPLSVLGSVLVDLIGGQTGLGYLILAARTYGPTLALVVWVATIVLAVLGVAMAQAVSLVERAVVPWDRMLSEGES